MKLASILVLILALTLLLSSCTKQLITPEELDKLKADKASLETQNTDLQKEVDDMKSQFTSAQAKAQLLDEVQSSYNAQPIKPEMPDHRWAAVGDGSYLFLQFNTAGDQLIYYGLALPGKFCKEDQDQLPPGFAHFQQKNCAETNPTKCAGGKGGEDGFWLIHIAKGTADLKYMPTGAPSCAASADTGAADTGTTQ